MHVRLPPWLKTNSLRGLRPTKSLLRKHGLATVCEEARCPNKGHCFSKPTAAFLILGDNCTRNCGFCSVGHAGVGAPDPGEPERVALAAVELGLRHVVITSVTRDDLADGGASHFARTIEAVRSHLPDITIEVLTPDFKGSVDALKIVLIARPDVFNHNVETVPALYKTVRPQADYGMSLTVLRNAKALAPDVKVKSGLMAGFGESFQEVVSVMRDLRASGCDFITIGQYMRPSRKNLPVTQYVLPEVFERWRLEALEMGFEYAASAPLVRSSMNAEEAMGRI
jgi:lipoic acid synthetase